MKKVKITPMQKTAFRIMLRKMAEHQPIFFGEIMREAGYSRNTSTDVKLNLTSKEGWKALLDTIDDSPLVAKLKEIAESDDKRAAMEAIKMILIDLKGRGAEKSLKVTNLFEKISEDFTIKEKEEDKNDGQGISTGNQLPSSSGTTGGSEVSE